MMRLCSGCQTKIPDGRGPAKCTACRAERSASKPDDGIKVHTLTDRERYAFLYKSERWKRGVQPKALKRCPLCARCHVAVSEIVDHIVPVGIAIAQAQESGRWPISKYEGFYLWTNLQGLCRACHAAKTDEDKLHTGPWPSVLEAYDKAPKKVWSF
jgi:5-methylcytosine-specific restriction endonuclease McrA